MLVDVTWNDKDSGDGKAGQENISYSYFYLPIDEDYQHAPVDYMEAFTLYVNEQ